MKVSLPTIAVPIVAAILCGAFMSVTAWEGLRTALLPTISIIAAAVLVRLARGLPFANADHFTLSQFRDVAEKLEGNARKLRVLIFVCLMTLASYIAFPILLNLYKHHVAPIYAGTVWVNAALSALMAFFTTYCFVRIIEVVQSDVGLLRLQSKIIEGVISRKNAAAFEGKLEKAEKAPIAGGKGFGIPFNG